MNDKVVLVTAANGGLGTYVTQAFLQAGATVVGTSRKIDNADFNHSNSTAIAADLSAVQGGQRLLDQILTRFRKLHVLAHTVGGSLAASQLQTLMRRLSSGCWRLP